MRFVWSLLCLVASSPVVAQDTSRVGSQPAGRTLVPNYQRLRPAGESVAFRGRPIDLALSPDGKTLYAKDNRGIVVVDVANWSVRQELPFGGDGGSLHGIVVSKDGARVYATNAQNQILVAAVGADGKLTAKTPLVLPGPKGEGASYPCGLQLSADERYAYVCLSRNNSLGVVNLQTGKLIEEIPVGIAPFDVVLSPDGGTAVVSNWGGRRPKQGERTAKSAGSDTLVDERGVANSGTVSMIDLAKGREIGQVETGLHPSDLAMTKDGGRVYVANANSDTISVIEVATRRVVETISTRPVADLPFGSAPNALALSADEKTLYAANGGNNAIAVISVEAERKSVVRGYLPTGWYPGGLAVGAAHLYIANVKGWGSRGATAEDTIAKRGKPDPKNKKAANAPAWNSHQHYGTLQRVAFPTQEALERYTAQVRADARTPEILRTQERGESARKPVPVPAKVGEPSVFEHIVYIIKENRTYDQVFGDLPQGNGDPALCLFGREVTPNHHALAEQFVLLDNFYCNGVLSADGHSWATEGNVTDHLEKAFGGFTRSYTFGDDPLTYSSTGFIWDRVLLRGLTFRNYGEMNYTEPKPAAEFLDIYRDFTEKTGKISFTHKIGIDRVRQFSNPDFPGWNMKIPDVLRAEIFLKEFAQYEQEGRWINFVMIYLPSDHTSGTAPNAPTPRAQVADNDLALGRIVEAISKSKFWAKTCLFVVEDDPQDGFDHVDGHRSPCLVISPYTKRGKVVSQFYNQTSVIHTMLRMLGSPPLNQMDAASPLMTACFTNKPDFRPYAALPSKIPLDEMNPPKSALRGDALKWAEASAALPLEGPDRAGEDLLNRILWHAMKGTDCPYPAHLAGAHGKGLKARKLKLAEPKTADKDD